MQQEAAKYWANPEGVAPRNQAIVTENATIPAFSMYQGCLHGHIVLMVDGD